jgi:uncharacterized protein YqiB (DUF1249 family)
VLNECDLVVPWRARPRGFVALMGLYESNYLRLARLAGELRQLPECSHSHVPGDCSLLLAVLERAPYTTELALTYLMPAAAPAGGIERIPDLRLRLYHDARLLEACGGEEARERELVRRWSRNLMVNKWLEYCLERGHSFRPGAIGPLAG